MRTIGTTTRLALEAEHSEYDWLDFMTVTHADLDEPIRLVNAGVDHIKDGSRWIGFPFELRRPSDDDDLPRASIAVQNVDKRLSDLLDSLTSSPTVKIETYLSQDWNEGDPRQPIGTPTRFYVAEELEFQSISLTTESVSGELAIRDYGGELYGRRCTQKRFPALFRGP